MVASLLEHSWRIVANLPSGSTCGKVFQLPHSRFGDSGDAVGFAGGIVQEEMRITMLGVVQRDRVFDAHCGASHGPS